MTTLALFLQSLSYGLMYSLILAVSFLLLARVNPEAWLNDYPPDIKAKYGAMSAKANRVRLVFGIPIMIFMLGFPFFVIIQLTQINPLTFWQVFGILLTLFTFFNLFDLLIIDWLVFNTIQPRFMVLPGTEGMAGYKDYGFHFRASLKGQIGLTLFSLIGAGITILFI
jgi:hypothetical protein